MNRRIVVFTGNLAFSVRKGIVEIDRSIPGLSWLVVLHSPRRTPAQLLRNQWRNMRRNGWRWIPYQLADLWQRVFTPSTHAGESCGPGAEFSMAALAARPNLRVLKVVDIHARETIDDVRAFQPHVGLSLAAPILRRELFAIPTVGTVNLHKGKVPDYRGMPPAFWELWNDEESVGCTVHWVDDRLDTGAVAAETVVEREKYSTFRGLQLRLDEIGVELMRHVIGEIFKGMRPATPQRPGGRTYRKPTLAQMAALNDKLLALQPERAALARRVAKSALSIGSRLIWRAGVHALVGPRITVLLYHRVSDAVRDNLTVGTEQFERQMALLRRHCRVLSIEEVLASQTIERSSRPLVCVTFDDGYLDNYINAVPSLLRHEIPAAFFVSTGIVNSIIRSSHDIRRGNPVIPMMQWEHLREMHSAGFTIGSHTVHHIDCALEPVDVVSDELDRSLADLRRELGVKECIFAYPYGGKQHMTPERLEMVKRAGYSGCLAAYGGTNLRGVERFNVLRRGINWAFSDQAFLFECVGLV